MSAIAFIVLCGFLAWRAYRLAGKVVALQDELHQSLCQSESLVRLCEQARQQAAANQAALNYDSKKLREVEQRNTELRRQLRQLRLVRRASERIKPNPIFADHAGGVA